MPIGVRSVSSVPARRSSLTIAVWLSLVVPVGCGEAGSAFDDLAQLETSDLAARVPDTFWLAPNVASPDFLELFSEPDQWSAARNRTGVFQFYDWQLKSTGPENCEPCGPNTGVAFANVDALAKLEQWGIALAIESGAIKEWSCGSDAAINATVRSLRYVEEQGSRARYIAMDEPLHGGQAGFDGGGCGLSFNEAVLETKRYILAVNDVFPEVQIGDIEPYPLYSADELEAWIAALAAAGITLPFFHLDVDLNALKEGDRRERVAGDLLQLQNACREHGIDFGVIFIGDEYRMNHDSGSPERIYYDTVMAWIRTVDAAIGLPDHAIVQSWVRRSNGVADIPVNLPESSSAVYSQSRILNEAHAILVRQNAAFVSQSVPASVSPNAAMTVEIKMRNTGNVPWSPEQSHRLGSQMSPDNKTWGKGRIQMTPGTVVDPGELATFRTTLTAPSVEGNYSFAWKMLQEHVEWFGQMTPQLRIVVTTDPDTVIIPPDRHTVIVEHAYRGILAREADAAGLGVYIQYLQSGGSVLQLCESLAGSPEFATNRSGLSDEILATELYEGILEREPDASGLQGTISLIQSGQIGLRAAAMLESPEFSERFL